MKDIEVGGQDDYLSKKENQLMEEIEKENAYEIKRGRKQKAKKDDSYETYDYNDVVKFIGLVEECEELWHPQKKSYHRRETCMEKFGEIEEKCRKFMPHNARTIGRCAKDRWDELTKDYAAYLTRIKKAVSGSGTADVRSDFKYADNLSFLCIAQQAREPKNAFCFGDDMDEEASPVLYTPKRKRTADDEGCKAAKIPKMVSRKSDSFESVMREEMEKNREALATIFKSPENGSSKCTNDRVCEVFANVAAGKSRWEVLEMEGKVIAYISSFRARGGSEPPTSFAPRIEEESEYFRMTPTSRLDDRFDPEYSYQ